MFCQSCLGKSWFWCRRVWKFLRNVWLTKREHVQKDTSHGAVETPDKQSCSVWGMKGDNKENTQKEDPLCSIDGHSSKSASTSIIRKCSENNLRCVWRFCDFICLVRTSDSTARIFRDGKRTRWIWSESCRFLIFWIGSIINSLIDDRLQLFSFVVQGVRTV